MKNTILVLAALAAVGCAKTDGSAAESKRNAASDGVAADNTKVNEREQPTPGDQGGSESDRAITQRVRQNVVKGDEISVTGKNVKIITVDGVVTLRGPVKSAKEKADIAAAAKQVDGVKQVDNQLDIAAN